ncbi:TraR/DksA family transcriptional regulator [Rhodovulum imhoffii]|uniref:TraR/DksA family transcriptional regulator n=1 Tax=Rhodovulum imhoffii TaxID=365340 RepID=A0A2T5BPW4_9RHOB|nr:TraR/DksA C4-type zinc finger protein [Rhodovulum imhoffii]MBK5934182.1 hypothetical protein [Rhodovulum imhoffii]PTN01098.1 TraR/DksA family transcriptional regulator [Rhodovulum imhoffii]
MAPSDVRRDALLTRLPELEHRLQDVGRELDAHCARDWEVLATGREDDGVLEQMESAGMAEIEQIRAALRCVDDGMYGVCVQCGGAISESRLDVLPATPTCRHCAK